MIGTVPPSNPTPPQYRIAKARAPIHRVVRELDVYGARRPASAQGAAGMGRIDIRI